MRKIWTYGTLRKGSYNHWRIGDKMPLEITRLNGYRMLIRMSYPLAIPSENPDDSIVVEKYEVTEQQWQGINRLERNFAYEPHEVEGATLWVYEGEIYSDDNPCEHGDFLEWVTSKQH